MEGMRQGGCSKYAITKMGMAATLLALSSPSLSLAHGSTTNSVARWAAGALLTAWNGTSYHEKTCFNAGGSSIPCDSPGAVQVTEEIGVEYTISVANRTAVPLDCLI